jgi:ATP-binding cassette subfamily F protein 3
VIGQTAEAACERSAAKNSDLSPAHARKGVEQKRQEALWRNELYRRRKPLQDRLEALESDLDATQSQIAGLTEQLADPANYQDRAKAHELQRRYQEMQTRQQELTAAWERHALALDELEQEFWKAKGLAVGDLPA